MRPDDDFEKTMAAIMTGLSKFGVQPSAGRGGQRRQAAARAKAAWNMPKLRVLDLSGNRSLKGERGSERVGC